jgi:hypothetical protein
MRVGVTATRSGLTERQRQAIALALKGATEGHHGDCVGGDAEFHQMCLDAGVPVIVHPPQNPKLRAFCQGAARVCEPLPYLVRNKCIVDAVDVMIGAPREAHEPPPARGQGTWSTIRYARCRPVTLRVVPGNGR